ncbi:hypothetical protein GCM10012320_22100 [Sinomonas cellulolyticus]|uniref:Uncharacterized protein n=1 Tax=Sinomonas cellulolyticus TaxID=2801916 RepID=A0ABS1K2N9_9MICC|nr:MULTISPECIES: hypothetical protein [Sinomonas]MBL0705718.1 hypothetical protein [Sinomonas cellulolyticus]GHG52105.1 hypothetical protein GCM10012320_22100 [Sinomonas sp. KCTC 49339]
MHNRSTDIVSSPAHGTGSAPRRLAPHAADRSRPAPQTRDPHPDDRALVASLVCAGLSEDDARAHLARLAAGDVWGG